MKAELTPDYSAKVFFGGSEYVNDGLFYYNERTAYDISRNVFKLASSKTQRVVFRGAGYVLQSSLTLLFSTGRVADSEIGTVTNVTGTLAVNWNNSAKVGYAPTRGDYSGLATGAVGALRSLADFESVWRRRVAAGDSWNSSLDKTNPIPSIASLADTDFSSFIADFQTDRVFVSSTSYSENDNCGFKFWAYSKPETDVLAAFYFTGPRTVTRKYAGTGIYCLVISADNSASLYEYYKTSGDVWDVIRRATWQYAASLPGSSTLCEYGIIVEKYPCNKQTPGANNGSIVITIARTNEIRNVVTGLISLVSKTLDLVGSKVMPVFEYKVLASSASTIEEGQRIPIICEFNRFGVNAFQVFSEHRASNSPGYSLGTLIEGPLKLPFMEDATQKEIGLALEWQGCINTDKGELEAYLVDEDGTELTIINNFYDDVNIPAKVYAIDTTVKEVYIKYRFNSYGDGYSPVLMRRILRRLPKVNEAAYGISLTEHKGYINQISIQKAGKDPDESTMRMEHLTRITSLTRAFNEKTVFPVNCYITFDGNANHKVYLFRGYHQLTKSTRFFPERKST